MNKKKAITLVIVLQIVTLICSVTLGMFLAEQRFAAREEVVANTIRGKIVYIGAPTQDAGMADSYIVYLQEEGAESNILRTILITPDTWLFDGQGGAIWEKCLNSDTAINDYILGGIEIEARIYPPDDSISDRHTLLYPAQAVEILANSE